MRNHIWDLEEQVLTLRDRVTHLRSGGDHGEAHILEKRARIIDCLIDTELDLEDLSAEQV